VHTLRNDYVRAVPTLALTSRATWWLAGLAICGIAGLVSVALGPDNYWDLRYYHLYDPWAYLHDRYLYDLGPAQEEGFLNPIADFLLYGMISSPLNEAPRAIAFIMGAVHGINAALLLAIVTHVLRPPDPRERTALCAIAWLIGVTGAGFVPLIGTCSNDLTSALFILAALLGLIKAAEPDGPRPQAAFAAAGVAAGLGIALKYTSAVFAPGLGVVLLMAAMRRRSALGVIAFGLAAAVSFFAVVGHHMLTLWNDFGSPVFPYMNQVFRSPWFEPTAIRDARFIPQGLWALLTFPFSWTVTDTYIVVEHPFRDWRAAIAYITIIAAAVAFVVRRLRGGGRRVHTVTTPGLGLVLAFVIISYFAWALGFGYYRYVVPLEMLTGVVTIGTLIRLVPAPRWRTAFAVAVLVAVTTSTVYPDWGRRPYADRYVDVHVPPLPENAVVLIATWDPAAFFIPYAEPKAQYVGIENNYLALSQNNKLATAVKAIMHAPGRPKFVVKVEDDRERGRLVAAMAQLGLRYTGAPCLPIETNLTGYEMSLCEVAEP
jgi:dolichyl-phosphate-mannose-protein mannosyltransferase